MVNRKVTRPKTTPRQRAEANAKLNTEAHKLAVALRNDPLKALRDTVIGENAQLLADRAMLYQAIGQVREQLAQHKVRAWMSTVGSEPEMVAVGLDQIENVTKQLDVLLTLATEADEYGLSVPPRPSSLEPIKQKLVVPGVESPNLPKR